MIFEIKDNIKFDNETIQIYKEEAENKILCVPARKNKVVASVHDKKWRPTIIYLAATTCNLKCKYCYADDGTYGIHEAKKQFTLEEYIETFEKLYAVHNGIKAISFFGGEPLINFREIKKFVEYLYANYSPEDIPTIGINTNGTIMGKKIVEFLCKYNIIIGTSIDGTKAIHDDNRISDSIESTYDLVIANLEKLKNKGLTVYVQYTFTKQHLDRYGAGKAKTWCKEMELLPISTYELIPVSSNDSNYKINVKNPETLEKYKQFCNEIADYYLEKILTGDVSKVPRMFMGLVIRLLMQVEQKDCSAGHSISITPNKKIYPCHTFTEYKEYAVDFDQINEKQDFDKNESFLKAKNSNRSTNTVCDQCISKKVCGVWCIGLQNSVAGQLDKHLDERCILMNIYTYKIIDFLANHYHKNRVEISKKVIAYNNFHKELSHES